MSPMWDHTRKGNHSLHALGIWDQTTGEKVWDYTTGKGNHPLGHKGYHTQGRVTDVQCTLYVTIRRLEAMLGHVRWM